MANCLMLVEWFFFSVFKTRLPKKNKRKMVTQSRKGDAVCYHTILCLVKNRTAANLIESNNCLSLCADVFDLQFNHIALL